MNKIILSLFLIGVLFLVGCEEYVTKECQTCEEPQIEKGKAILNTEIYSSGVNEYNSNELLFQYWITNYGDVEAKNIKVRCNLLDENYNILKTVTDTYGNLASKSIEFGEAITKKPNSVKINKTFTVPVCYVESCNSCEILYKRIPKIVEVYEGLE